MILITGAGGWLGTELTKQLLEKGNKVRVLNNILTNSLENLKDLYRDSLEIVIGDICDSKIVNSCMSNIEKVFHLAAKVHSIPTNKNEEEVFYKINTDASRNIFEECLKNNIKRVIFFSTVSVYENSTSVIDISSSKNPETIYGKSKLEAEKIANKFYEEEKLPITIIEPVTVYGEGDVGNFIKLEKLIKKGVAIRFGDGENKKTIIYFKDLISMVINISQDDKMIGKTIICGTEQLTINNINDIYIEKSDKKVIKFYFSVAFTKFLILLCKFIELPISKKIKRKIESLMQNNDFKIVESGKYINSYTSFKEYELKKQSRNKKVLFTATVDSHIISFHLPYLKLFKDNGYEVHVATNTNEPIEYCDVKHKVIFERSPFKINNLRAIKQLKKIIDNEKFDIIHCHTPMGSVVTRIAAIRSKKLNNTKVIYTVHGFHFYKGAPVINWLLFYPIEKYLSKYTNIIITINKEDYELAKNNFTKTKVEYVPGVGVDEKKFDFEMTEQEKTELRESLGLKQNDFVMIYTAELNKNKNQIMAIKAMKELVKENSKIHLLLVGQGNLREYYENKVEEYNLQNNIHFLGYRSDVPKLLKIADLVISTSKREGLPVNIIEGLFSKLPIVVTNCRGNRDLVVDRYNGFIVDINDEDSLKNKILYIMKNRRIQRKFSKNSASMSNRFILNDVVFSIGDIYKLKEINEPIRVLHCIRGMNVGGAETFIMNVYRNINREEFQFDFLASKDGYFDNEIQKLGGKIYKIPYLTDVGQFKYVKELKNFFNNHKEYKIIHSHIDQVSGIILETAKKCNMPVRISHSHSSKNMNGLLGKVYKKYLQSKIIKNATEILACSQEAANWLFRSKAKDAIIVKNGIDIKKYKYSEEKRQRIRKELEISDDIIVIGHVGSFLAVKNHEFIIDVYNEYLKLNPKAMLVLVGQGILLDKMYDKVKNLNLEEKVKFLGLRNDTDFLYSAFDVFLFPSLYEGLSLALIEAQTSSLNIFASNTIDKATNITGTINFLDLNSGAKKWAENILKSDKKRNDNIKKIEDSGYNISNTVDILKDIYISAIKSINK